MPEDRRCSPRPSNDQDGVLARNHLDPPQTSPTLRIMNNRQTMTFRRPGSSNGFVYIGCVAFRSGILRYAAKSDAAYRNAVRTASGMNEHKKEHLPKGQCPMRHFTGDVIAIST